MNNPTATLVAIHLRRVLLRRSSAPGPLSAVLSLLAIVALPLALVGILGVGLQGLMGADFTLSRPYEVVLVAESPEGVPGSSQRITADSSPGATTDLSPGATTDSSPGATAGSTPGIAAVRDALAARPRFFNIQWVPDPATARDRVARRQADAAVVVPDAFPAAAARVIAVPGSIVEGIVGEAVGGAAVALERMLTSEVSVLRTPASEVVSAASQPAPVPAAAATDSVQAEPQEHAASWLFSDSFTYYAVGITVMFAMYAAHAVVVNSARDRSSDVYARLQSVGVSSASHMTAGAVAGILVTTIFIAAMTGATTLLFGANWGHLGPWALLTATGAAAVAGMSLAVMAFVSGPNLVDPVGTTLFNVLGFLGGSMTPLSVLPNWFETSFRRLPNRIMLDGYLKLAQGAGMEDILSDVVRLAITAGALMAVGGLVFAWRARKGVA